MDCLKSILSLTRAQTEAISEEGMDGLQSLIDQKQSKIDEINGLDEEFNACFTALKQKLGVKSLDEAGHWHKRSKRTAKPGFKDNGAFKRNKRSRKEQQRKGKQPFELSWS